MNIAGCGWLCALHAMKYVQPAVMLCLNMGMIPITNFVATTSIRDYPKRKPTIVAIVCVVCSMLLIMYQQADRASSYIGIGVMLSLLDGVGGAYNGLFSATLTRQKFSASDILMLRFLLLCLVSGAWCVYAGDFAVLHIGDLRRLGQAACLMLVIPLFMYQQAIAYLGADIVALLLPFIPIGAYFIQLYQGKYGFDVYTFLGLLLCCCTIGLMHVINERNRQSSRL